MILSEAASGWRLNRMGKAELTILRIAVYEIRYDEEVPDKVAINEAVELAKKYGIETGEPIASALRKYLAENGYNIIDERRKSLSSGEKS